jgi:hypothetical protein
MSLADTGVKTVNEETAITPIKTKQNNGNLPIFSPPQKR